MLTMGILGAGGLSLWPVVGVAILGYVASLVVYRRFFHPLARVPGPFLASVTVLYQSYYNRFYYKKIGDLHEKYGPVVRIKPNEVHLSDSENYDKIYYVGTKFSKDPLLYGALCVPHSTFGSASNEIHRHKRGILNPFFSRQKVLELEEVVQDKARKVCKLMENGIREGKPVDLHHAFRSVSIDVITDYAFDRCFNLLDLPDLGQNFFRLVRGVGPAMWVFQQFPSFQDMALKVPPRLAPWLSEPLGKVTQLQQDGAGQVEDVRTRISEGKLGGSRATIFNDLLDPKKQEGWPVPPTAELKDEVYSFLAAAADTTGNGMTTAAYNVMANPEIYKKLHAELREAFPDPNQQLDFVTLEKLPYLTGVIKEGLRLSFGVIGRMPRVTPPPGVTFNGYYLAPGTVVGMSSWTMHRDAEVFPEPMVFKPERWLKPEDFRKCDKNMVPFGRGTRQCVGMPLAYAELYVTIGTLFHRFGNLKVYKTTPWDMEYEDFFSSYHIYGRNWFKAIGEVAKQ